MLLECYLRDSLVPSSTADLRDMSRTWSLILVSCWLVAGTLALEGTRKLLRRTACFFVHQFGFGPSTWTWSWITKKVITARMWLFFAMLLCNGHDLEKTCFEVWIPEGSIQQEVIILDWLNCRMNPCDVENCPVSPLITIFVLNDKAAPWIYRAICRMMWPWKVSFCFDFREN